MNKAEQLAELERTAKDCTKCSLSETRKNVVFGTGDADARVVLIGEAPGLNEDVQGIPFCGKAGSVLNRLLLSIKLNRNSVYIANILKCRPPNNRDPLPEEIACCRTYLEKQLAIIDPVVIGCLGRFALRFILDLYSIPCTESISRVHGKVFSQEGEDLFNSRKIVALYHPAVATYNPNAFDLLKEDFAAISSLL